MRVALSTLSVKPGLTGGGECVLRHFVRYLPLVDRENQYVVFVTSANRSTFDVKNNPADIVEVPSWVRSPALRVMYEFLIMPRAMEARSVDLYIAFNQIFSPLIKCKVVAFVQNLLYYHFEEFYRGVTLDRNAHFNLWIRNYFYRRFGRIACSKASHIVAVSQTVKNVIEKREGVSSDRITVVPLALSEDLGIERTCNRVRGTVTVEKNICGSGYFLIVGAVEPYKNIVSAIEALALVRQGRHSGVSLAIVGLDTHGYGTFLRHEVKRKCVADAVDFIGSVSHECLYKWYRGCIGLLLLSECEAFPLPVLEAMSFGVSVIAANKSGVAELVGDAGLLVDPRKPSEVSEAMTCLLEDRDLSQTLSARGGARVSQFSWRDSSAALSRVISSVG